MRKLSILSIVILSAVLFNSCEKGLQLSGTLWECYDEGLTKQIRFYETTATYLISDPESAVDVSINYSYLVSENTVNFHPDKDGLANLRGVVNGGFMTVDNLSQGIQIGIITKQ